MMRGASSGTTQGPIGGSWSHRLELIEGAAKKSACNLRRELPDVNYSMR
jgi:hypothetical protein